MRYLVDERLSMDLPQGMEFHTYRDSLHHVFIIDEPSLKHVALVIHQSL